MKAANDPLVARQAGDAAKRPSCPMTPNTAMKQHMKRLSNFEYHEIFDYPEIYFVGENAAKIQGTVDSSVNYGYDDGQGSYIHVEHDHIAYRYETVKLLGKGSFGHVTKVFDHKEQVRYGVYPLSFLTDISYTSYRALTSEK